MAKGVAIKFSSYEQTIPRVLDVISLSKELKKYDKIVLKPSLNSTNLEDPLNTPTAFVESVLNYIMQNKNPVAEVFIAEGSDGLDTLDAFEALGYNKLAEDHDIGLVDLNDAQTVNIESPNFLKFSKIKYPKILSESFVISIPKLAESQEYIVQGSLSNMLGAFPARIYAGLFSNKKKKIRKYPMEYAIRDIVECKRPDLAIIDASDKGYILAGQAFEMDKQASKLLGKRWENIPYLRLLHERLSKITEENKPENQENKDNQLS